MQQISTSEFKSQLGQYLASTQQEPLTVEKAGRPIAVVVSPDEYEHLQELEDLYWLTRAAAAEKNGEWLSHDESLRQLASRLSGGE